MSTPFITRYNIRKAPTPPTPAWLDTEHANIQRAMAALVGRIPVVAFADLPVWTDRLTGYIAWDSTNDRLVVYGMTNRKYYTPGGTF